MSQARYNSIFKTEEAFYDRSQSAQTIPAITLYESKSMAVLTHIWQRKVMPYLSSVLMRMCAFLFIGAIIFFIMAALTPRGYEQASGPLGGLAMILTSLFENLHMVTKVLTYWFTGPQALILCYAFAVIFIAAVKVFRLRFIKTGQTTASISHKSIIVRKNWLSLLSFETTIKWYDLALVSIRKKPADGKMEELLCFAATDGRKVEIDAACLHDSRLRSNLIAMIKRHAPHTLSNELEEKSFLIDSTNYADIWMDTLHQRQVRKREGELTRGASLSNERFQVVRKLGSGGQGTAYLATVQYLCDKVLNEGQSGDVEMVVLKEFILPGFENPALLSEIVARIQHEALLLKSLNHRQIVRVIDAFIEDLRGYLVIEHATGTSLREFIGKNGPINEAKAIELASQMCTILEYLHGHAPQVVHRDFTPDNLIIDDNGILKLIDFNLAKVPNLNDTDVCVGKPSYMAPEQVRGRPEPASDFYSMGALLHFLLTGQDPEPLTVCSPREAMPSISMSLNHLIERLTFQDTSMRINSASQVRNALALQKVPSA
ncbi:MAG: serine/threonine protein kinase [Candidatus Obscuribacterales bacterium]|nr:serine/threonine protein kinase [Candidatus Obscuribacterales bacterium]